jgi:hypothetical protein
MKLVIMAMALALSTTAFASVAPCPLQQAKYAASLNSQTNAAKAQQTIQYADSLAAGTVPASGNPQTYTNTNQQGSI